MFIHKSLIFMSTNLAIRIEKFDGKLERTDWVLLSLSNL